MIVVIDYGMGNLGSIVNMLRRIGADVTLSADLKDIERADRLILPGVGAFDRGMENLHNMNVIPLLNQRVLEENTPILGLCLGMQLFGKGSEEGNTEGLGWIDAQSVRFRFDDTDPQLASLRVPHMGWNGVHVHKSHPMMDNLESDTRYYFVHAYHVRCNDPSDVLATTRYGIEMVSAFARGPITGMQFHPEKSLRWGMRVFEQFVAYHAEPAL
jgi:glutamine amidotransferase